MDPKQNTTKDVSLRDKNSPATSYLLSVLEKKTYEDTFPSIDGSAGRVGRAFKAFSDILPNCGVYSPVLKLVKEELFEAVYSNQYTVSGAVESTSEPPPLIRIPYFAILKRFQEHRNETVATLTTEVNKLTQTIKEHEENNEETKNYVKSLKSEIEKFNKQLAQANGTIDLKNQEINEMGFEIENLKLDMEFDKQDGIKKLTEISDERDELKKQVDELTPYKNTYSVLKDTFDLPADKRPRRSFRRPILSTKKTQILCSIESASKIEQQILEVQNKTLEEYDLFLEKVKADLSEKEFSKSKMDPNFFNEEMQLENLSDEMSSRLNNFRRLISGMVVELELIQQHRETLQNQLAQLEQTEMGARTVAEGEGISTAGTMQASSMAGERPGSSRMLLLDDVTKKADSQPSVGGSLEEDHSPMASGASDPFNPDEKVLSKYSAMLYTSRNGGKSFDEVACAKFCISCGEKTVVCPHKVTKDDLVITLPRSCTHVKIVRPHVRLISSFSQQGPPLTANSMNTDMEPWNRSQQPSWDDRWGKDKQDRPSVQLQTLWDDFKQRTGTEKSLLAPVSRELSHDRVLSLTEQFYANVLHQDDTLTSKHIIQSMDEIGTFKDYLYNFMSERYQEDEVTPLATFDFLTAITRYADTDKIIHTFGLVLTGALDGSVARYIHLLADVINLFTWTNVGDFHTFCQHIYSFMHEEDMDQFLIEYTAFSENKISSMLVMNYIIQNIIKNKEPRIQDVEATLAEIITTDEGLMTMEEFCSAMETNYPLANVRLWKKLMLETYKTCDKEAVSIQRLATIVAYVNLVQVESLVKDNVTKLEKKIQVQTPDIEGKQSEVRADRLICQQDMRLLAGNISRQKAALQQRTQFDDMFWSSRPTTQGST